jgi:hypothetical protein
MAASPLSPVDPQPGTGPRPARPRPPLDVVSWYCGRAWSSPTGSAAAGSGGAWVAEAGARPVLAIIILYFIRLSGFGNICWPLKLYPISKPFETLRGLVWHIREPTHVD